MGHSETGLYLNLGPPRGTSYLYSEQQPPFRCWNVECSLSTLWWTLGSGIGIRWVFLSCNVLLLCSLTTVFKESIDRLQKIMLDTFVNTLEVVPLYWGHGVSGALGRPGFRFGFRHSHQNQGPPQHHPVSGTFSSVQLCQVYDRCCECVKKMCQKAKCTIIWSFHERSD